MFITNQGSDVVLLIDLTVVNPFRPNLVILSCVIDLKRKDTFVKLV